MRPTLSLSRGIWVAGLVWWCAGACGGEGDSAPSFTPVSATSDGAVYTLTLGSLKMVIDGAKGARITEFSLDGADVLTDRDVNGTNYGATYWPSPQASWCATGGGCWPPPAAIDNQPYTGAIDADTNVIRLTSGATALGAFADSSVTVIKEFTPKPESGAIDVTYTLTNASAATTVSIAPWQVSRVAVGGLTFFGKGDAPVTYAADSDPAFVVTEEADTQWYDFAPVGHNSKALADGTGWLAHATEDRLLYLLAYPDIQPSEAAPGEAEVELFTGGAYVEIEPQGAVTSIAPGATLPWTVRWQLRRLPSATTVAPGSADLASFASATLAEGSAP
jgi:hypothetical protein